MVVFQVNGLQINSMINKYIHKIMLRCGCNLINIGAMNYIHILGINTIIQKSYLFCRLNQWYRFKHNQFVEQGVKNITYYVFVKVFNKQNQVCFSAICWLKYTLISFEHKSYRYITNQWKYINYCIT